MTGRSTAGVDRPVEHIVIVGGGTAGWLAACLLAARLAPTAGCTVTLVESPDIATIGVGEGTWPTMRHTLARIGIGEAEFLTCCDAAFKQGSRFTGWVDGAADDSYYHPFTPPVATDPRALVAAWAGEGAFADAAGPQPAICREGLAPRQRGTADYVGALNYAYHLDATKLAALLARHATERLGVRHLRDHVVAVERASDGDIASLRLRDHGPLAGDFFLDCTGHAALLIGGELDVSFIDRPDLLNDRALAVQLPVALGSPIAAQTDATAHAAGWIWDIGLPTRRGVGCVYASAYCSDEEAAATLASYLGRDLDRLAPRRLAFRAGHRERFWERNCLALGLAAGFMEPLEASAIVLIELSLNSLIDGFPRTRGAMARLAPRFNALFRYRWDRIVDFLKLHYVLSRREEPYWQAQRDPATVSARLSELLELWRDQPPSAADLPMVDEVFPAASYQYVLYGMRFAPPPSSRVVVPVEEARAALNQAAHRRRALQQALPTTRAYLDALRSDATQERIA